MSQNIENFTSVPDLPHDAIYMRSFLNYRYGVKFFDMMPCRVVVVGESAKSFRILFEGRETWVRKQKIKFTYLDEKSGFCELRQKYIPRNGCRICYKNCFFSKREAPQI